MIFITWLAQRWANIVRPTDNHTPTVRFNANVGPTLSCYLGSVFGVGGVGGVAKLIVQTSFLLRDKD